MDMKWIVINFHMAQPVMNEEALNQIKSIENVENASFYRSRSYADSIYYQSTSVRRGFGKRH